MTDAMQWTDWFQVIAGILLLIGGLYGNHKFSQWERRYIAKAEAEAERKYGKFGDNGPAPNRPASIPPPPPKPYYAP